MRRRTDERGACAGGEAAGRALALVLCAMSLAVAAGCSEPGNSRERSAFGNPARGEELIGKAGCGSCHTIPGIAAAKGLVGPPLDHMGRRVYIAGTLQNTPDNMIAWLRAPQSIRPGSAMPNMGLGYEEARDIAAYLYTLR
jgi:cytochrome c2